MSADHIVIPEACFETVSRNTDNKKLSTYNGYKEDIYIADHIPDNGFLEKLPFRNYYVIRPEAMASFYVESKESLVTTLLKRLEGHGENVVLLPRDRSDWEHKSNDTVHIPDEPLNGLDLIYHSNGVLTGSGTMAREAAVMGKPAVSFFPNRSLLSVDQDLVEKGKMIHSRNVDEIINYLDSSGDHSRRDSKKVKNEVLSILFGLIGD